MDTLLNPHITIILEDLRQNLQNLYGETLSKVILYGSQARKEAQPDSDIDILIVLNQPFNYSQEIERTSLLIADLSLKYNTLISRSFTDSQRLALNEDPFIRNIHRDGILGVVQK